MPKSGPRSAARTSLRCEEISILLQYTKLTYRPTATDTTNSLYENTVEDGYNVRVVINEQYNVLVNSEELIGTTGYDAISEVL